MYCKRVLSQELIQYRSLSFPKYFKNSFVFSHTAIIGVGGNMGDVKRRFEKLLVFLHRTKQVQLLQTTSIIKNPPFGYLNQPFFYNAIIVIQTNLTPKRLLKFLHMVEKRFKRKRIFKDAPRTLDLDILFFDNIILQTKQLTIPHKEWYKRQSVVIPLAEVV